MSQIYLKREIAKDGLPKQYGWYFIIYKLETGINEYHDSAAFKDGGFDFPASRTVTHWLDPVEWPTEEEQIKAMEDLDDSNVGIESLAFESGFEKAIEWLKSRLTNSH